AHGLRRLDERDRGHEPAELIDRVEGLLHRADAWYAGVIAVALDRVHDQAWYPGLLEDRLPVLGMSLGIPLVVKVVQEAGDGPGLRASRHLHSRLVRFRRADRHGGRSACRAGASHRAMAAETARERARTRAPRVEPRPRPTFGRRTGDRSAGHPRPCRTGPRS